MKKNLFLLFASIGLFTTSCSISQEFIFNEEGAVSYHTNIDLSEMMKMSPEVAESFREKGEMEEDGVILLSSFFREKMNESGKRPSAKEELILKDLEKLFLKTNIDEVNKQGNLTIFGDFKNTEELNAGLLAMTKINSLMEAEDKIPRLMNDFLLFNSGLFSWDGKKMVLTVLPKTEGTKELNEEEEEEEEGVLAMISMFSSGKMKTTYRFPKRVKSVSNPNALFTQDGKSVILAFVVRGFEE